MSKITNATRLIEIQNDIKEVKHQLKRSNDNSSIRGAFYAGLPLLAIGGYSLVMYIIDSIFGHDATFDNVDGAAFITGFALVMAYVFGRKRNKRTNL